MARTHEWDTWGVLPNRKVLDCCLYHAGGHVLHEDWEHVPCGGPLRRADIEDNWCPHCCETLNAAANKRARAARSVA